MVENRERKTVGVVGGMGPAATVEFLKKLISLTPAKCDQEHLHLIIDHNPTIPDRTRAILGQGESPLSELIASCQKLEKMGVDFLVIPCNTACYFLSQVEKHLKIPIINLVEEVSRTIKKSFPEIKRIGLLATTGTIQSCLYQKALTAAGIEVVVPEKAQQKKIMEAIYQIKSGKKLRLARKTIREIANRLLKRKNVSLLVAGCTEIPLVLKKSDVQGILVDSLEVLAEATVRLALGEI